MESPGNTKSHKIIGLRRFLHHPGNNTTEENPKSTMSYSYLKVD